MVRLQLEAPMNVVYPRHVVSREIAHELDKLSSAVSEFWDLSSLPRAAQRPSGLSHLCLMLVALAVVALELPRRLLYRPRRCGNRLCCPIPRLFNRKEWVTINDGSEVQLVPVSVRLFRVV
eukprot:4929351-Pyramimonas_sp.AAC.1